MQCSTGFSAVGKIATCRGTSATCADSSVFCRWSFQTPKSSFTLGLHRREYNSTVDILGVVRREWFGIAYCVVRCHLGSIRRGGLRMESERETVSSVEVCCCRSVVFAVSAVAVVLPHIQNVRRAFPSVFSDIVVYRGLFDLAVWATADVLLELCRNYGVSRIV